MQIIYNRAEPSPKQHGCTFLLAVVAATQMLTACSSTQSSNVKTAGIVANYSAVAVNTSTATCTANFTVGGTTGTNLDLSSGDVVTCNGQPMSRVQDPITNQIHYDASVPAQAGQSLTIVFTRTGETPYTAVATIPNAIHITAPASGMNLKKGSVLMAIWPRDTDTTSSITATLSYETSSSGVSYFEPVDGPDTGTVSWNSTQTQTNPPQPGSWAATVTLIRTKVGVVSPGLSGTFSASQMASVKLNLID